MGKGIWLGEFEQMVLLALIRLKDDAYGMRIRRELAERARREISIGAVYSTLNRLESKGYVTGRLGESTPERGGRPKKFFQIEASGVEALSQALLAASRMRQGIRIPKLAVERGTI